MRILFTITLLIACVTFTFAQSETTKTKKAKKSKKEITTTPFQDEGWQAKGVQGNRPGKTTLCCARCLSEKWFFHSCR